MGFEPTVARWTTTVFETATFGRSVTSPPAIITEERKEKKTEKKPATKVAATQREAPPARGWDGRAIAGAAKPPDLGLFSGPLPNFRRMVASGLGVAVPAVSASSGRLA